ncbi:hypothetical protein CSC2_13380 [Clostridium zeae]|uniref:Cellulase n=1 Tax=Clostridium zeae TaxID=2759022 RepID=A0ABQ1E7Q0_9CLOT|nr:cellulase-like family protein [Clostridium zeae]GFZ30812.1 hypothetical protein CSC2_13380 [Clostridium zeae]
MGRLNLDRPLAITMWDFSWLERRWPGAGYEDWDKILEELKERGYDVVRIDAYPHLLATDAFKEWTLIPFWNLQTWGSQSVNKVTVYNNLKEFLEKCKKYEIKVALSTWFREDECKTAMNIRTPEDHGQVWKITLDYIKEWGLIDNILYVDLCNEFPLTCWAPFLEGVYGKDQFVRDSEEISNWMKESIKYLRQYYTDIPLCYSFVIPYTNSEEDVSYMDLIEPHIWMAQSSDFYEVVGYNYERFDSIGYDNLAKYGEKTYRENPSYWKNCLAKNIENVAQWSIKTGEPIITTECWGVVDYKDWPLLNWDWVKELCEFGVKEAISTGRWIAIATSNFCGPQFKGMWRDIQWHKKLTDLIHESRLTLDFVESE